VDGWIDGWMEGKGLLKAINNMKSTPNIIFDFDKINILFLAFLN
jgi:hypothetical protein